MKASWCLCLFDGVAGFEESARQRFLIREDSEAPSFEHVLKQEDCGVDREEFQIVGRVAGFGGRCSSTEESQWLKMTFDDLVDCTRDGPGARVGVDA